VLAASPDAPRSDRYAPPTATEPTAAIVRTIRERRIVPSERIRFPAPAAAIYV
jgi:hypothetical protein